jgi:hypothetical protein
MKIKSLTVKKLHQICSQNKYILLRERGGILVGVNCKVSPIGFKKFKGNINVPTNFVSYFPCSFHEYISNKIPFLTP